MPGMRDRDETSIRRSSRPRPDLPPVQVCIFRTFSASYGINIVS